MRYTPGIARIRAEAQNVATNMKPPSPRPKKASDASVSTTARARTMACSGHANADAGGAATGTLGAVSGVRASPATDAQPATIIAATSPIHPPGQIP